MQRPDAGTRPLAWWLFACCATVFATVVVGGITRLTHSGLSIVEWQPLLGALPPLTDADWTTLFAKYRLTPEFQQVNHDMTLDGFKSIFWWEWSHRLVARLNGVVFLLPWLYFVATGRLRGKLAFKVLGFFALGGLQGAMGWYMVQSGLVDDPRVSHFRLAAHLGLAFIVFGLMFWTALGLLQPRLPAPSVQPGTQRLGRSLIGLVFVMVLSGALVAGIRAGLAYNSFPLMNGQLIPAELLTITPWWRNFFYNMATVQFDHRLLAWVLAFLIPWFALRLARQQPTARLPAVLLVLWLAVQVSLGIATLLLRVPVPLAAAHQAGAVVLFALLLLANHALCRAPQR